MRAISEEAGYSTGVLTHYFADKDALVLAALRATVDRARQRVEAARSARAMTAVRRLLQAELISDDEDRVDQRVWLAFYAQAPFSELLAAEERAIDHEWRALAIQFLAEAAEAGEVRPGLDLAFEADRLLALVDGISAMAMFDSRYWTRRHQLETLDRHLRTLERVPRDGPSTS